MNTTQAARVTLRKTDSWASRDAFLAYCRQFKGYRRFDDEAFQAMAKHGVQDTPDGRVALTFPKVWEAHNYTQPPNVMGNIGRLRMPCVAIRGKPSAFFTEKLWQEWREASPDTVFLEDLSYGHLLPLEAPEVCCALVRAGLGKIAQRAAG